MTNETITVMRHDREVREMDSLESAHGFIGHKREETSGRGWWIRVEGEYRTFRVALTAISSV